MPFHLLKYQIRDIIIKSLDASFRYFFYENSKIHTACFSDLELLKSGFLQH